MSSVCVCLCGSERRRRASLRWSSPESPWLHQEWVSKHHAALFKWSFSNTNFTLRPTPPALLPLVSHPAHHHAEAGKIQVHAEDYVSARTDPSDAGGSVVSREESSWGVLSWSDLHRGSTTLGEKNLLIFYVSFVFAVWSSWCRQPAPSFLRDGINKKALTFKYAFVSQPHVPVITEITRDKLQEDR